VQAAGGMIVWPEGYLRGVRELCTKYNVLLIADEVATGFGRTGKMFACEHEQITPDIMCLSKGITNGYMPLAVTLTSDEIYSAFLGEFADLKTFFHGHSYAGNPLACAAAIAAINMFDTDATLQNITQKNGIMQNGLSAIAQLSHVGDVRCKGMMAAVELVKDKVTRKAYDWEERIGWKIAYDMRNRGVIIRPLGHILVLMPPLAISNENLAHLMRALKKSIIAVTGLD
jgi:adenosylmethionine-8-amino-7-oxononanoate aminotransferase